jgi:hydrogenase nickel incorporation protein HypA/HybF
MHELSIAMSLIDVITETLIRENATGASRVSVEVGALSGVVPAALQTAFSTAIRGTELAACVLDIIETPGRELDVVRIETLD